MMIRQTDRSDVLVQEPGYGLLIKAWCRVPMLLSALSLPVLASTIPEPDPAMVCARLFADRFEQQEATEPCDSNFDINVPAVLIDVQVTLNGNMPPASVFEDGEIRFIDSATGDEVFVGLSSVADGLVESVWIVPGRYDAVWTIQSGGAQVPENTSAVVGSFLIDQEELVTIDVPMVTVAGNFTIDGEPPVNSPLSTARIYLRNEASGDLVELGQLHNGSYVRNIIPGTYQVVYEFTQGLVLPKNTNAVVDEVTILNAPEIIQTLDLDLVTGFAYGDIRFDGQLPPGETDDFGRIWFIDAETGDEIHIGSTLSGAYSVRLLAGNYDVYYRMEESGGVAPVNSNARLLTGVEVQPGGNHEYDLNIRTVDVQTAVTINGQTPPASVLEFGRMVVRNEVTGDAAMLGETHLGGGHMQARVVQGIYDLFWELVNGGSTVPGNERARLSEVGLRPPSASFEIDVPMVILEGDIRFNGMTPPALHNAHLELGNRLSSDRVLLGDSSAGAYQRRLIPGPYDTVYRHDSGANVPANPHAIVGETCVSVSNETPGTINRDIDLYGRVISGTILLDGQIPPASGFESGFIRFRDKFTGDEFIVGESQDGNYSVNLLAGRYEVYYSLDAGGEQVPRNTHALIGELSVCQATP